MNEIETTPDVQVHPNRVVTAAVVTVFALVVASIAVVAGVTGRRTSLVRLPASAAAGSTGGPSSGPAGGAQPAIAQLAPAASAAYQLAGPLPVLATHAPAYRIAGPASVAAVAKLAAALGLKTAVTVEGSGWSVVDGSRRLEVQKGNGGRWTYTAVQAQSCVGISAVAGGKGGIVCGPGSASGSVPVPVPGVRGSAGVPGSPVTGGSAGANGSAAVGSAGGGGASSGSTESGAASGRASGSAGGTTGSGSEATGAGTVLTVPPAGSMCPRPLCPAGAMCSDVCLPPQPVAVAGLPSGPDAVKQARALLTAAGLDLAGADIKVSAGPTADIVTVNPSVGGLPTTGMVSTVTIGAKGVVDFAQGMLSTMSKLGDYPLVGTAGGFKRLQAGQLLPGGGFGPRPALGMLQSNSAMVVTVTGAHLVLAEVGASDNTAYLEPAYEFESATTWMPLIVSAVSDGLLQIAPAVRLTVPKGPPVTAGPMPAPTPGSVQPSEPVAPAGPASAPPLRTVPAG